MLFVIDIYSKYAWFDPLKDKKGFQKMNHAINQTRYG